MAVQVSQDVYDYVSSERDRFQQQANDAEAARDTAEDLRAHSQNFADQAQSIIDDLEVSA